MLHRLCNIAPSNEIFQVAANQGTSKTVINTIRIIRPSKCHPAEQICVAIRYELNSFYKDDVFTIYSLVKTLSNFCAQ